MSGNPFVPAAAPEVQEEIELPDAVLGERDALTGPSSPAVAPAVIGEVADWPLSEVPARSGVMVMGLHGGAGTTLVCELLARVEQDEDSRWDAWDVGTGWPVSEGWARPRPVLNVVAVYRTHQRGVRAAESFARAWAKEALPDSRLLGMIAVDDGPGLLQAQKTAVRRIGQMTPHGWHLPWVEEWRITDPDFDAVPRRIRKTLRSIRKTVTQEGVTHE